MLLGFDSYADMSMQTKMAQNLDNVRSMLATYVLHYCLFSFIVSNVKNEIWISWFHYVFVVTFQDKNEG